MMRQFLCKPSLLTLTIGGCVAFSSLANAATVATIPQLSEAKPSVLAKSCEGVSALLTANNTVIDSVETVAKGVLKLGDNEV